MAVRWYTRVEPQAPEKGPFDTESLIEAVHQGHVSEKTLVRREGHDDWSPICDQPTLTQPWLSDLEAANEADGASERVDRAARRRFSWGLLLVHVAVAFVLFFGLATALIFGSSPSLQEAETMVYASGRLFVTVGLPVVALCSYRYQKRRR